MERTSDSHAIIAATIAPANPVANPGVSAGSNGDLQALNLLTCPNCNAVVIDRFCGHCGQKFPRRDERSLRHFLSEAGGQIFNLDGKPWQTFKYLMLKPGQLSAYDIAGVRKRFMSPLALFLTVMVLFFYSPVMNDFALPLNDHYIQWYGDWARAYIQQLQLSDSALSEFSARFQQQETDLAKTLVLLHAPLLALALWLLHARKPLRFVDHLVVSLHFWALLVIYTVFLGLFLYGLGWLLTQAGVSEERSQSYFLWALVRIPFLLFVLLTLKNAYQQSWWSAIWRLPLAFAGVLLSHFAYRAILFSLTLATM